MLEQDLRMPQIEKISRNFHQNHHLVAENWLGVVRDFAFTDMAVKLMQMGEVLYQLPCPFPKPVQRITPRM